MLFTAISWRNPGSKNISTLSWISKIKAQNERKVPLLTDASDAGLWTPLRSCRQYLFCSFPFLTQRRDSLRVGWMAWMFSPTQANLKRNYNVYAIKKPSIKLGKCYFKKNSVLKSWLILIELKLVDWWGQCGAEEADLFPGRGAVTGGGGQLLRLVLRRGGLGRSFGFPLLRLLVLLRLLGLRVGAWFSCHG